MLYRQAPPCINRKFRCTLAHGQIIRVSDSKQVSCFSLNSYRSSYTIIFVCLIEAYICNPFMDTSPKSLPIFPGLSVLHLQLLLCFLPAANPPSSKKHPVEIWGCSSVVYACLSWVGPQGQSLAPQTHSYHTPQGVLCSIFSLLFRKAKIICYHVSFLFLYLLLEVSFHLISRIRWDQERQLLWEFGAEQTCLWSFLHDARSPVHSHRSHYNHGACSHSSIEVLGMKIREQEAVTGGTRQEGGSRRWKPRVWTVRM